MKNFRELTTGLRDSVLLSESPTHDNYSFRFKDSVIHPEVSSATVRSHDKGHDVEFAYKGHHIRASAATKVGNDPTTGSANGFFRTLHISKGKKFDDQKLVYSHGATALKVDKEKVDKDKVNQILPHVRNITEHLIRHSDRELEKHLKTKNNTLKEDISILDEDVDHKKAVNAAWDGDYNRFMKHMGIQKQHKETDHVFVKADAHYHRLAKLPQSTKREDAIKSLSEDFDDEWEHFGEAAETRMNGGRKYTYDPTDRSNDPYHQAKLHRQGRVSYEGAIKAVTHMGLKGDSLESFKKTHLDPHKEEGKKNLTEYMKKMEKFRHVKEDTTEPAGSQNEQDVPVFDKRVDGSFLKMIFKGDASKASSVLSQLKRAGKLKDYKIVGNMLIVEFLPADSNHHLVIQGLAAVNVFDKGDVRSSEIEDAKHPDSDSAAQGEDHTRKPIK